MLYVEETLVEEDENEVKFEDIALAQVARPSRFGEWLSGREGLHATRRLAGGTFIRLSEHEILTRGGGGGVKRFSTPHDFDYPQWS